MRHTDGKGASTLVGAIGTKLLAPLEADAVAALNVTLRGRGRFVEGPKPVETVRSALRSSTFAIQNDPHGSGDLVQRFLRYGALWQMEKQLLEGARDGGCHTYSLEMRGIGSYL